MGVGAGDVPAGLRARPYLFPVAAPIFPQARWAEPHAKSQRVNDLLTRLQAALGDAFRVERELTGGGMSRLFLATEASLNRSVVIKVLPPELTSEVSAARFKQEMEFAARLQHPHILPVLAAGAPGDLLYYVMPWVTGESLRHRMEREGRLPVADAVRLLADRGESRFQGGA